MNRLTAFLAVTLSATCLQAESILYPPTSNVVNITSYGVDLADNTNDDTAKIQQAIYDNIHKGKTIYFPNGVYNISSQLLWKRADGVWETDLAFQGQSRAGVIFKLKNSVYPTVTTDTGGNPILYGVIVTASQNANSTSGSGNQAFQNCLRNFTVDIGSGNAAAVGIKYLSNNCGQISDITIKTSDPARAGYAGLNLTRSWPGPSLVKNLTIIGFNYGVDINKWEYGMVFENLSVQNQLVAGIRNKENVLSIRKFTSVNTVPAVSAESDQGHIALVDANCSGGASTGQAILFKGGLLARNLVTTGYAAAIRNNNNATTVAGTTHTEYVSHPVQKVFASPLKSLNLPVEETPAFEDYVMTDWVVVDDAAADDTAAIQAAMNSGKRTVCFKSGARYKISNTITVSGAVRRIIGLQCGLEVTGSFLTSTDPNKAVFKFENLTAADVTFERFSFFPFFTQYPAAKFTWFVHATTKPLIIKNICAFHGEAYRNTVQGGKVFIEDAAMWGFYFNNQQAWARQVNPEFHSNPMMVNEGENGRLWILGLKSEGAATVIATRNGASTEVIGGLIYPIDPPGTNPMFINNEGRVSLSFAETGSGNNFSIMVRETRNGSTLDLTKTATNAAVLPRGGKTIPLYAGYAQTVTSVNLAYPGGVISAYSGQEAANPASNVIDGVDNSDANRWSVYNYPQWIEVDLGANRTIQGTELVAYAGRAYKFRIEAKAAGGAYTTIVDRTSNTTASPIADNLATPVTARYLRFTVTGAHNYTGGFVSIREFKVLGN